MTPEAAALHAQSRRLAPFRDRLLRRVSPGLRGTTLDLACGPGTLGDELTGRVRGPVIALDFDAGALGASSGARLRADAHAIPLRDATCDLVVTQASWLWFRDPARVATEVLRVLAPGGALVSCGEPDFGGALEHPESSALAPVWEAALQRAGAHPRRARELPALLRAAGFARVEAEIFGHVAAEAPDDRELLRALPLTEAESDRLAASAPCELRFVPWMGVIAWR